MSSNLSASKYQSHDTQHMVSNKTLIFVRWMAIIGQSAAVLVTEVVLGVSIPLIPVALCIFLSVLVNIIAQISFGARSLPPFQAWIFMAYDIVQLAVLLWMTGGLENPFALLILAPASVGATLLPLRFTLMLVALAFTSVLIMSFSSIPLDLQDKYDVYPHISLIGEVVAISVALIFICLYIWRISSESRAISRAYEIAQLALAKQQETASLGTLSAAAAHELGSPLSTIGLISNDLSNQLEKDDNLQLKDISDDIRLLQSQSQKCRELLHNLGSSITKSSVKDLDFLGLDVLIRAIAEPYTKMAPDIQLQIQISNKDKIDIPRVHKSPVLEFGLGNILQNAFKYAEKYVCVEIICKDDAITIEILDDGPGFSNADLRKIGDPFISNLLYEKDAKNIADQQNLSSDKESGMGLGIFIAKTLLQNYFNDISFSNRIDGNGARVVLKAQRENLAIQKT